MELFPAADEEQFEFIKTVIDQSDYYVIISAGRYGSIHPGTMLSYTEMEYDYAVEIGKPVIRLLHKDPKSIADEDDGKLAKLLTFRNKMRESRMVAFWETPDQLGKEATYALLEIKKSKPAIGWAKASDISDKDSRLKIGELMEENRLLRENLSVHEKKDFRPILEGLSGEVELQKFEFSGAEINDSWPLDREPNLEVRKGLDKYLYQPIGEPFQKPASWIMERICFGFLFGRDFESAVKKGLASPHPIGTPNSIVCAPTDEHSLEPLFMAYSVEKLA